MPQASGASSYQRPLERWLPRPAEVVMVVTTPRGGVQERDTVCHVNGTVLWHRRRPSARVRAVQVPTSSGPARIPVDKSVGVAFVLTFFFGPLGLLYVSVWGGLLL